jgi:hypothetical protein
MTGRRAFIKAVVFVLAVLAWLVALVWFTVHSTPIDIGSGPEPPQLDAPR